MISHDEYGTEIDNLLIEIDNWLVSDENNVEENDEVYSYITRGETEED